MSNDFDQDFDDFNENDFNDFKTSSSLKDIWDNNPIVKIIAVLIGVVLVIILLVILLSEDEENRSRVGFNPDQREAPGGEVSQAYGEAIELVNENRAETAMQNPNVSAIPIPYNLEETDLLTETDEGPPFDNFDPLAAWRQNAVPEEPVVEEEPVLAPYEGPIAPQPLPGPSPDVVNSLAQAMSQQMNDILGNHAIQPPQIMQVTPVDFLTADAAGDLPPNMVDTDGDGIPDTVIGDDLTGIGDEEIVETILIPAGSIHYAQIMIEANSDVPGPVLAQLVSGPLAGSKLIGSFESTDEYLVLTFNTVVVDGIGQTIDATAIDPATTLPGVATEVDKRYFKRVLLPAAGAFLEGVGRAVAQDTQTVTVSGDTVTSSQRDLDLEQELGKGAEEAAEQVADFLDEEADNTQVLVRVARGTPVGVFFTSPVLEQ
jgi:intracellular multiplication protein IcmE